MGTQFWWFYDVLILAAAGGLLYNAAAKGFGRMVFPLIGCILAFAAGVCGSRFLAEPVYHMLFSDKIIATIQAEYEETDIYPAIVEQYRRMQQDDTMTEQKLKEAAASGNVPEPIAAAAGEMAASELLHRFSPLPPESAAAFFTAEPEVLCQFLNAADAQEAAAVLEQAYFRPFYLEMVRTAVFLLLAVVMLIVVGILSNMAGDLEQLMHIRKGSRILAFPIGIVQAAFALLTITVSVRLIVLATNNQMMLFNEETIAETIVFHYIYDWI